MNFEVNGETYYLSLAENERQWLVFVSTETGARPIPVYVDSPESDDFMAVVEDRKKRKIVN